MATKKQKAEAEGDTGLLAALQFVKVAQLQAGPPHTRHCIMWDGMVYASNGILSAGHPVIEHLRVAPHTGKLVAALERCTERMSMAELSSGLSVKSSKFRATVPCHVLQDMPPIQADPPVAPVQDEPLRAALEAVAPLATDGAQRVMGAVVMLSAGPAVATNGFVVFECWHGIDLPTVLLPKNSVKAVLAEKKKIVAVGVSSSSFTFHYEDNSWIKTQLYIEKYPDYQKLFTAREGAKPWPIPVGFFDALRTLKPFVAEQPIVYFGKNVLHTEPYDPSMGASVELSGIPEGHAFNLEQLLSCEANFTQVDWGQGWSDQNTNALFYGPNARGLVVPIAYKKRAAAEAIIKPGSGKWADMDDDIPF